MARTITGKILKPAGDAWPSASVRFFLLTTLAGNDDGLVTREPEIATTDIDGAFSITLETPQTAGTAWRWLCLLPDDQRFLFWLAAGDALDLAELVAYQAGDAVEPSAIEAAIEAHIGDADAHDYDPLGSAATVASDLSSHESDTSNPHAVTAAQAGAEPDLGDPAADGYVLSSTVAGTRSWVEQSAGGGGAFLPLTGGTLTGDVVGTDFVKTRAGTITRDGIGQITQVALAGGRTITITRSGGVVTEVSDGSRTWTLNRSGGLLTGWSVA